MVIELIDLNGTPCYAVKTKLPAASSIHGATHDKDNERWVYPAYAPFEERVFHDLNLAFKGATWTAEALEQHQRSVDSEAALKKAELPAEFTFKTPPFQHQLEGVSFVYHRMRAALLWAMGTGKSKVIVDLKRLLPGQRMLIISPKVTLYNWQREFGIHGEPSIKVGVISGTLPQKRAVVQDYKNYDVLVASYGTARNMGFPILQKKTLAAIEDAAKKKTLTESGFSSLTSLCRQVGDASDQVELVERWLSGETLAGLTRVAKAMRAKEPQYLADIDYDILVADESHNLQSNSSEQTKSVKALGRKAKRRVIASGTVSLGDPRDLYAQMQFLSPALMPEDYLQFQDMFLIRSQFNKHQILGYKNLHILNERLDRVATRKTREECLDLPERQIFDVLFDLEPAQKKLYNELVKQHSADLAAMFDGGSVTLDIANSAVLLNKLGQVCSGFVLEPVDTGVCNNCPRLAKCVEEEIKPYTTRCTETKGAAPVREVSLGANPKMELLEELLDAALKEPGNKAIVWAQYTAELNHLEAMLQKRGLGYVRVDGSTGARIQGNIDKFNNDPACRVYVSQVATGIGITLNSANYTFYYSVDWSLGTYLQSLDRNYRAGQQRKVVVYRLFGRDTVELYKAQVLQDKQQINATLTSKLACNLCSRKQECEPQGVDLFDPGCMYQRRINKTVAKAKELE